MQCIRVMYYTPRCSNASRIRLVYRHVLLFSYLFYFDIVSLIPYSGFGILLLGSSCSWDSSSFGFSSSVLSLQTGLRRPASLIDHRLFLCTDSTSYIQKNLFHVFQYLLSSAVCPFVDHLTTGFTNPIAYTLKSVSYTHLDVYKRQVSYSGKQNTVTNYQPSYSTTLYSYNNSS